MKISYNIMAGVCASLLIPSAAWSTSHEIIFQASCDPYIAKNDQNLEARQRANGNSPVNIDFLANSFGNKSNADGGDSQQLGEHH